MKTRKSPRIAKTHKQCVLYVIIFSYFVHNKNFHRQKVRCVPMRSLRSSEVARSCNHHTSFNFPLTLLSIFDPILLELKKRIDGDGGSMFQHSIGGNAFQTRTTFFETTTLLTESMNDQLNIWLKMSTKDDGKKRRCIRALANHYETSLQRPSKDCKPLLLPHRDYVNDADISIVVGITPRSQYRGALLYVSNERDGKVWYNKAGCSPSRKSVIGIDVCEGVCVILNNNVEHYVSALQNGKRGSMVFHMSPQ